MNNYFHQYNNLLQQPQMQVPISNNNNTKQKETKSTNGTKDMKSNKEVSDELESLVPTKSSQQQMKTVLNNLSNDKQMQKSSFINMLKKISDKPPKPDQNINNKNIDEFKNDQWLNNWRQQFQQFNSNNPIDNVNWSEYLNQLNPMIEKDTGYKFSEENPYLKENKTNNNNNNNNEQKEETDYFKEGVKLMNSGNLN